MLANPGGGSAVVVNEKGSSIWGYSHLPAWRQEALLGLVLGFGGAVGGQLRSLRIGKSVLHRPPYLNVVGSLEANGRGKDVLSKQLNENLVNCNNVRPKSHCCFPFLVRERDNQLHLTFAKVYLF